jgi:hypothetical protein
MPAGETILKDFAYAKKAREIPIFKGLFLLFDFKIRSHQLLKKQLVALFFLCKLSL